ncbi:hypothetical protein [Streptomyces geranii]|uniref:hypothetical protein n=1 Tax=Streptomyces geranii TaxID=2058923 RepID=UPI000D04446F|nr:hypothetical protein [Streptomyces geranii]
MATSSVVRPAADRRVLLLLLDDQHRLMLCDGYCGGWTVPQVLLTAETEFQDGATRYLAERFHVENPHFGTVYGVHETDEPHCREHDHRIISHVFIVRISPDESNCFQLISPSHTRRGIGELKYRHQEISPEGATLLFYSYLEGWLPNGPISLY